MNILPFLNQNKKDQSPKKQPPSPPKSTPTIQSKPEEEKNLPDSAASGTVNVQDIIAPPSIEVDFTYLKIGSTYTRTLFVAGYPRYVSANWLSPLINFDHSLDVSMFIYPIEVKGTLDKLRRRIAEMEAEIGSDVERGRIPQASTQAQLEDAKSLQSQLTKGVERFFQFSLYITISTDTKKELETITSQVQSLLGSLIIVSKIASLSQEEAFKSTLPYCKDKLLITRNMDTTALSTTFPFTSSELTDNKGILYGINEHNESLVIFDRFSLENANMLVLATSGAGKSYLVKLEMLRSLMFGTNAIIIDPENEYEMLCKAVGGNHISFETTSANKINPFQLPPAENSSPDEMNYKHLFLTSLLKIMLGEISPDQDAILNQAINLTYQQRNITQDPSTHNNPPPRMEDLYKVLIGMEEKPAQSLARRLEKFVKGGLRGIFDQQSNIDLDSPMTVFSLKETADEIRPIIMFMILDFIWTQIRRELKRRLLIVDEAWYLMRHEDSAQVLQSFVKRARKYYLGVSIISQNVEDFLNSQYGSSIVTNSAIQFLMKQSPAAIDKLADLFYLSQGEKHLLLSANVGEGIFFAGQNHVALRVVSSPDEHALITTKPQEILDKREKDQQESTNQSSDSSNPPQSDQT